MIVIILLVLCDSRSVYVRVGCLDVGCVTVVGQISEFMKERTDRQTAVNSYSGIRQSSRQKF